ncbi:hypothetical protein [Actinomadura bangladeshensis]|uniref:GerMN domain-containing protein n=1 Tax=Actinomadura bangladeshensis TaxID=453573 RepID=A0A4R4P6S9_9ACTN|nr:hypothetical protein [Actinomadura bangladeshensis]TDC17689.1 hypothetical protein E1284_08365 [Actinomadura bangladeshensis]
MSRRRSGTAVAAFALAAVLAAAGCGVRPTGILSAGSHPVADGQAPTMTLYLVRGKRLARVARPGLAGHPYLPLAQLGLPVTADERRRGLHSEIDDSSAVTVYEVRRGVVGVQLPGLRFAGGRAEPGGEWSRTALAQVVCTAEAIPGVSAVLVSNAFEEGESQTMRCDRFADLLE